MPDESLSVESLPVNILESIRHQLKDKKIMQEFFSDAREITKKGIVESESILKNSKLSQNDVTYAITNYLVCTDKLKRIDDFEMIHLNLIDLQEQIKNNHKGTNEIIETDEKSKKMYLDNLKGFTLSGLRHIFDVFSTQI